MTTPNLLIALSAEEGLRLVAYQDTMGIWTIGYGHAHVSPGTVWTKDQALAQLQLDINTTEAALNSELSWWSSLSETRQDVIVNMAFNLGVHKLLSFNTFLGLVKAGNYGAAADDLAQTAWDKQVGHRADVLEQMMRSDQNVVY